HLYTLEISAQGAGLDDALLETFGFREFRAEGKRFLLNEKEIRLRPTHVNREGPIAGNPFRMRSFFAGLRSSGFNAIELWPWDRDERGRPVYDEIWCSEADRLGFLVICPALDFGKILNDWEKPGVKADWQKRMVQHLDPLRNHPSIILWATGANRFGHGHDQNPEAIGSKSRAWLPLLSWRRNAERGEEAAAMIKQRDPTRSVLLHAGGAVGDIYTANNYLCLIPLQEREEWLSRWVTDGDMPVLMVEFGTPLYTTFHRGRRGYQQASTSEPLYSEFCAIYQGKEAYRSETPAYRSMLASTFQKDQLWSTWHNIDAEQLHPGYMRLQELFIRNTWRAWRTWGITGGMVPWSNMGEHKDSGTAAAALGLIPRPPVTMPDFVPGQRGAWHARTEAPLAHFLKPEGMIPNPVQEALSGANQETLAWLAGAPDFVNKTHHYRVGQKVEKQLALLNDSRRLQPFDVTWFAELNGARIAEGRQTGEIASATTTLIPIGFSLPTELAQDFSDGVMVLQGQIGEAYHSDRFSFRVFRPTSATPGAAVAILDPIGDTAALLASLGVTATPWDGVATDRLLVVGRNALAKGGVEPAAIEKFLRSGGRALLMAQNPDWLRYQLGLRVAPYLTRRGFPTQPFHPALGGLDAEALRDWAGESRLISPTDVDMTDASTRYPLYGWRWGNRHAISSAAIEVPHRAGWRPLISCEFDSAYTPLAELAIGSGRLTICTLDLEDHAAADPAAERLARSILAHAATARSEPRVPVSYLGGPAGSKLLESSGILHAVVRTLPKTGLVVLGAEAQVDDAALDGFLKAGGKALILPRRSENAPMGVQLTRRATHSGSLELPIWSSCRGLMPGELRRRADGEAWIVTAGADTVGADGLLAEIRRGTGVAVYFQLDVEALEADRLSYNRLTRWRWTRALAQIASNLGAECIGDRRLFMRPPPPDRISLAGTWKAALTAPLPEIGANDPKPPDPG
ncbi:MAG: beta-galactosidase, partial [Kiritimatiellia bacterium]|nr:beta-galactosidase [Kiritimatiellia bacterium]